MDGVRHPPNPDQQHVRADQGDQDDGDQDDVPHGIWPKFIRLKNAPTPAALKASFPLVAIHCESKFC